MKRCLSVIVAILSLQGLTQGSFANQALPQRWRKTMTSDPATNYVLKSYSGDLPDRMATIMRNVVLFRAMAARCQNVKFDRNAVNLYEKETGVLRIGPEDAKSASILASAQFDYLDYDALAHLCAGSDYLFGPRGVLIRNAMSKGSGELAMPYDPRNPYFRIRPFIADELH